MTSTERICLCETDSSHTFSETPFPTSAAALSSATPVGVPKIFYDPNSGQNEPPTKDTAGTCIGGSFLQKVMDNAKILLSSSLAKKEVDCSCDVQVQNSIVNVQDSHVSNKCACRSEFDCQPKGKSLISIPSDKLEYMKTITDLATKEKQMKNQIECLKSREQTYKEVLKNFENRLEAKAKYESPMMNSNALNIQDELTKISQDLKLENQMLKNELTEMKLELKHTLERIEGPMLERLETEKCKCAQLEKELHHQNENLLMNQDSYAREMNSLKMQLCLACTNMTEMNAMNVRLKSELKNLDCMCNKLEEDLVRQKVNEAETLKLLSKRGLGNEHVNSELISKQPYFNKYSYHQSGAAEISKVCPCSAQMNQDHQSNVQMNSNIPFKCDEDLHEIARKLSQTLRESEPCGKCANLPAELKGAAKCIKDLTDMVVKHKGPPSLKTGSTQSKLVKDSPVQSLPQTEEGSCQCAATMDTGTGSVSKTETLFKKAALNEKESSRIGMYSSCDPCTHLVSSTSYKTATEPSKLSAFTAMSREICNPCKSDALVGPSEITDGSQLIKEIEPASLHTSMASEVIHSEVIPETGDSQIESSEYRSKKCDCNFNAKVEPSEKPPEDLQVTTVIQVAGSLEIITEGASGLIETALTYKQDGNIEVLTKLTEYRDNKKNDSDTQPDNKLAISAEDTVCSCLDSSKDKNEDKSKPPRFDLGEPSPQMGVVDGVTTEGTNITDTNGLSSIITSAAATVTPDVSNTISAVSPKISNIVLSPEITPDLTEASVTGSTKKMTTSTSKDAIVTDFKDSEVTSKMSSQISEAKIPQTIAAQISPIMDTSTELKKLSITAHQDSAVISKISSHISEAEISQNLSPQISSLTDNSTEFKKPLKTSHKDSEIISNISSQISKPGIPQTLPPKTSNLTAFPAEPKQPLITTPKESDVIPKISSKISRPEITQTVPHQVFPLTATSTELKKSSKTTHQDSSQISKPEISQIITPKISTLPAISKEPKQLLITTPKDSEVIPKISSEISRPKINQTVPHQIPPLTPISTELKKSSITAQDSSQISKPEISQSVTPKISVLTPTSTEPKKALITTPKDSTLISKAASEISDEQETISPSAISPKVSEKSPKGTPVVTSKESVLIQSTSSKTTPSTKDPLDKYASRDSLKDVNIGDSPNIQILDVHTKPTSSGMDHPYLPCTCDEEHSAQEIVHQCGPQCIAASGILPPSEPKIMVKIPSELLARLDNIKECSCQPLLHEKASPEGTESLKEIPSIILKKLENLEKCACEPNIKSTSFTKEQQDQIHQKILELLEQYKQCFCSSEQNTSKIPSDILLKLQEVEKCSCLPHTEDLEKSHKFVDQSEQHERCSCSKDQQEKMARIPSDLLEKLCNLENCAYSPNGKEDVNKTARVINNQLSDEKECACLNSMNVKNETDAKAAIEKLQVDKRASDIASNILEEVQEVIINIDIIQETTNNTQEVINVPQDVPLNEEGSALSATNDQETIKDVQETSDAVQEINDALHKSIDNIIDTEEKESLKNSPTKLNDSFAQTLPNMAKSSNIENDVNEQQIIDSVKDKGVQKVETKDVESEVSMGTEEQKKQISEEVREIVEATVTTAINSDKSNQTGEKIYVDGFSVQCSEHTCYLPSRRKKNSKSPERANQTDDIPKETKEKDTTTLEVVETEEEFHSANASIQSLNKNDEQNIAKVKSSGEGKIINKIKDIEKPPLNGHPEGCVCTVCECCGCIPKAQVIPSAQIKQTKSLEKNTYRFRSCQCPRPISRKRRIKPVVCQCVDCKCTVCDPRILEKIQMVEKKKTSLNESEVIIKKTDFTEISGSICTCSQSLANILDNGIPKETNTIKEGKIINKLSPIKTVNKNELIEDKLDINTKSKLQSTNFKRSSLSKTISSCNCSKCSCGQSTYRQFGKPKPYPSCTCTSCTCSGNVQETNENVEDNIASEQSPIRKLIENKLEKPPHKFTNNECINCRTRSKNYERTPSMPKIISNPENCICDKCSCGESIYRQFSKQKPYPPCTCTSCTCSGSANTKKSSESRGRGYMNTTHPSSCECVDCLCIPKTIQEIAQMKEVPITNTKMHVYQIHKIQCGCVNKINAEKYKEAKSKIPISTSNTSASRKKSSEETKQASAKATCCCAECGCDVCPIHKFITDSSCTCSACSCSKSDLAHDKEKPMEELSSCTCQICSCSDNIKPVHDDDCYCEECTCPPDDELEKEKDEQPKLTSKVKHDENCTCQECTCPLGDKPFKRKKQAITPQSEEKQTPPSKKEHDKDCTCQECTCPLGDKPLKRKKQATTEQSQNEPPTKKVHSTEQPQKEPPTKKDHGKDCTCQECTCPLGDKPLKRKKQPAAEQSQNEPPTKKIHDKDCTCQECTCPLGDKPLKRKKPATADQSVKKPHDDDCTCVDCNCPEDESLEKENDEDCICEECPVSDKSKKTKRENADDECTCQDCPIKKDSEKKTSNQPQEIAFTSKNTDAGHPFPCNCNQCICEDCTVKTIATNIPLKAETPRSIEASCDCPSICDCDSCPDQTRNKETSTTARIPCSCKPNCICEMCGDSKMNKKTAQTATVHTASTQSPNSIPIPCNCVPKCVCTDCGDPSKNTKVNEISSGGDGKICDCAPICDNKSCDDPRIKEQHTQMQISDPNCICAVCQCGDTAVSPLKTQIDPSVVPCDCKPICTCPKCADPNITSPVTPTGKPAVIPCDCTPSCICPKCADPKIISSVTPTGKPAVTPCDCMPSCTCPRCADPNITSSVTPTGKPVLIPCDCIPRCSCPKCADPNIGKGLASSEITVVPCDCAPVCNCIMCADPTKRKGFVPCDCSPICECVDCADKTKKQLISEAAQVKVATAQAIVHAQDCSCNECKCGGGNAINIIGGTGRGQLSPKVTACTCFECICVDCEMKKKPNPNLANVPGGEPAKTGIGDVKQVTADAKANIEQHYPGCTCIECFCNTCAGKKDSTVKTASTGNNITTSEQSPHPAGCTCVQCFCSPCGDQNQFTQQSVTQPEIGQPILASPTIQAQFAGHPTNCSCVACKCFNCPFKSDSTAQYLPGQSVPVSAAVVSSKQISGKADICTCAKCNCFSCPYQNSKDIPKDSTIASQPSGKADICTCAKCNCFSCPYQNSKDIPKDSTIPQHQPDILISEGNCNCIDCICPTCPLQGKKRDKGGAQSPSPTTATISEKHDSNCTCQQCLCVECYKLKRKLSHPANCTCDQCTCTKCELTKGTQQLQGPQIKILSEPKVQQNSKVENQVLNERTIPGSPHPAECSCPECMCVYCVSKSIKKSTESEDRPNTISLSKKTLPKSLSSRVKPEGIKMQHPSGCSCEDCSCQPCMANKKNVGPVQVSNTMSVPLSEIVKHGPECNCKECVCTPCIIKSQPMVQSGPSLQARQKEHPENCLCEECLCKPLINSNYKPPAISVSAPLSQTSSHRNSTEHPKGCLCKDCICDPCRAKPFELAARSDGHPPDCICDKCICHPCKTPVPAPPTLAEISQKLPMHSPDCHCKPCICYPCKAAETVVQPTVSAENKLSQGKSALPTENICECTCSPCKCKDCPFKASATEESTATKEQNYGQASGGPSLGTTTKHRENCTCDQCVCPITLTKDTTLIKDNSKSPSDIKSKIPQTFLETNHGEDCTCNPCKCKNCPFKVSSISTTEESKTQSTAGQAALEVKSGYRPNCTCTDCTCVPCITKTVSLTTNQTTPAAVVSLPTNQTTPTAVTVSHGESCDCDACKCKSCPFTTSSNPPAAPTDRTISAQVSKTITPQKTKSVDCTCEPCLCINCYLLKKEKGHPLNCNCSSCTCRECQMNTNKAVTISAKSSTHDSKCPCETCLCVECYKMKKQQSHPTNCICEKCTCKMCQNMKNPKKLPSSQSEQSVYCSCSAVTISRREVRSQEERRPLQKPDTGIACKCSVCNCVNSKVRQNPPLVKEKAAEIFSGNAEHKIHEAPFFEIPKRMDCNCVKCQCYNCKKMSKSSPNIPPQSHTGDSYRNLDDDTLKKQIANEGVECNKCRGEIDQIMKALSNIKSACNEAESKAYMTGKKDHSCQMSFNKTMSTLQNALGCLQEKCRKKDLMIMKMTEELQLRNTFYSGEEEMQEVKDSRVILATRSIQTKSSKEIRGEKQRKQRKLCKCSSKMAKTDSSINERIDLSGFEIMDIRRITVDSLIVKWNPPKSRFIVGYDIFVNGVNVSKILSGERSNAMLHKLDLSATVQITIYAVTKSGRCQPPAIAIYEI